MPHLYLVDGSGYIFRAYHRLPPLTNKHGEPVGAVYGYTTMLWRLADEVHAGSRDTDGPTHMAVVLDKSSHTFRNELYDDYKAHRPPPPEDLVPQFPMIRDATRAFSLPCIEEEGLEADDIIACYTNAALAQGWRVTIVSSDKDLMQLMADPSVELYDTMNNRRLGPDHVRDKFGVGPEQLGDVLALMGDSVRQRAGRHRRRAEDRGQADRRAWRPGRRAGRRTGDEEGQAARQPDRAGGQCPAVQGAGDAEMRPSAAAAARRAGVAGHSGGAAARVPGAHGFKTLLGRLGQVADAPVPAPASVPMEEDPPCQHDGYETVTDEAGLDRWIAIARHQGWLAIDTETSSTDATRAELVGISMALHPNLACYVPLGHGGSDLLSEAPVQLTAELALAKLKPLLEDPGVLKIGHNLKFDLIVLGERGIDVAPYDDTIVMSFDLDAGLHGHGMDELAATHLSHSCIAFKDVVGTGKSQRGFTRSISPPPPATPRRTPTSPIGCGSGSARGCRRRAQRGSTRWSTAPLVAVIARMERRGIKVDRERLAQLSTGFAGEIAGLETEIHQMAGGPFTIGSPKQLGDVLFERLGLKGGRKGKSGVYSTDVTELERLAREKGEGHEIVGKVLDWRQLTKLKNTYTDALQDEINPATGRVHTSYSLTGAQTGRLSSTEPNLQNIPIRTETGRQIRDAFVAEPGNVILSADYSQIELRLAAHIADVPQLRDAFAQGDDIHALTATELFGEVTRDTRARAKTINFAILYGISRWGLAGRLDVSADEAQAMIDTYFERFPGITATSPRRCRACASAASPPRYSGARRTSRASRAASSTSARAPNAPRSTRRSRAPARTSSSARWHGWSPRWPTPASARSACCSRSTMNWCSSCPRATSPPRRR